MDWSFWDFIWASLVVFLWITVLIIFFQVVIDIFRSHDLTGWAKAGWLILIVVLPFIGLLVYLVTRGPSMAGRAAQEQLDRADRIRAQTGMGGSVSGDPTQQITQAKALLDSGAIDQSEFDRLKSKALS